MWAYTDDEIGYLSMPRTARRAVTTGTDSEHIFGPLTLGISRPLRAWLDRQAVRAELETLDARALADLGSALAVSGQ
jgi:uncharacterized protein YjiS (DUF1127 family)